MFNIGDTVIVKGTIEGIERNYDGTYEYKVQIPSSRYDRGERVYVDESTIRRNCFMTMDELETACKED